MTSPGEGPEVCDIISSHDSMLSRHVILVYVSMLSFSRSCQELTFKTTEKYETDIDPNRTLGNVCF